MGEDILLKFSQILTLKNTLNIGQQYYNNCVQCQLANRLAGVIALRGIIDI